MNIFRILLELLGLYLLYKLVFDFIIPVYNTTKHVKQKVTEMQQKVNQFNQQQQAAQPTTQSSKPSTIKEDYIDYEEVK